MVLINENYLKLKSGYLFPEIEKRVREFLDSNPEAAPNILKAGIGDVTEPLSQAVRSAMKTAVDELGKRETFRGYGPPFGYPFIRKAIAENDFQKRGLKISEDEIFLSDGAKGDSGAILDILASGGQNIIAVPDPVYPVYVDTNVMAGNTGKPQDGGRYENLVYLECSPENNFVPEIPDRKIDIIYLCYPNNPTGSVISRPELTRWVEYANKNNALILYDVAYQAFIRDKDAPRSIYEIEGARSCAMELHSFSKNGGFTGVRCGYTVCPHELKGKTVSGEDVALHGLWSRRWSTKSNGVSYVVQKGAAALYSDQGQEELNSLVDFYLKNAALLAEGCKSIGLQVFGADNSPYVWVSCPSNLSSWEMFDLMLKKANVIVTPGAGFGRFGEGYFRISAFNSREAVNKIVERIGTLTI